MLKSAALAMPTADEPLRTNFGLVAAAGLFFVSLFSWINRCAN
jgi:hypothetical protein